MKTWNIGVVGAGLIADFHARAIGDIPNARLVGFCDAGSGRAKQLADKYACRAFADYRRMTEDDGIDILAIATPSGFHMEPAVAAAEAGKHVLCEKPLEVTLDRIDAMIAAHKKAGTQLGGIFPYRFNDAMTPLRQAIESGRFGTITYAGVYVPWWRTDAYYKNSWHGTWKLDGGGALMNQSIHMIDMLCDVMPPVESVQAYMHHLGHPEIEAEDTAVVSLRFTNGAVGIIYGTTASWPGQFRRFEITGTKGTVVYLEDSFTTWKFADETNVDEEIRGRFGQVSGGGGVADPGAINYENHTRNFRAFLDSLETGGEFSINGQEARKAVALILAIYESARTQKCVRLA
ncbi:MAG: Gfo/Idh/MocA family oxidoreductase [Phycisphaerae bacterium]|nr:Gfo/Idh/MocA family oxidoreductase [Phycisphaerae bacterium]